MPGFLSPGKGMPLFLIPEYSGINKGQRVPDRSKTAHRKPLVKCFLTGSQVLTKSSWDPGWLTSTRRVTLEEKHSTPETALPLRTQETQWLGLGR